MGIVTLERRIIELERERDHWKREAIKWAAQLGEQKIAQTQSAEKKGDYVE